VKDNNNRGGSGDGDEGLGIDFDLDELLPVDHLAPRDDRLGMAKVFLEWAHIGATGCAIARKLGRIPHDRLDAAYAALELRIRDNIASAEATLTLISAERGELALEVTRGKRGGRP
jgi:hypothetical protein